MLMLPSWLARLAKAALTTTPGTTAVKDEFHEASKKHTPQLHSRLRGGEGVGDSIY